MKKVFEAPICECVKFAPVDVIATSGGWFAHELGFIAGDDITGNISSDYPINS